MPWLCWCRIVIKRIAFGFCDGFLLQVLIGKALNHQLVGESFRSAVLVVLADLQHFFHSKRKMDSFGSASEDVVGRKQLVSRVLAG